MFRAVRTEGGDGNVPRPPEPRAPVAHAKWHYIQVLLSHCSDEKPRNDRFESAPSKSSAVLSTIARRFQRVFRGWAGLDVSHGVAVTLDASSSPPWFQNWRPNTAK